MGCMRNGNKRLPLSGCLAPNPGRRARLPSNLYGLTQAEAPAANLRDLTRIITLPER
jgi:hypothetical protein